MNHKHILIAVDGSDISTKAAREGVALAKQLGAQLSIVSVSEPWSALEMAQRSREGASNPVEDFEKEAASTARRILAAAEALAKADGVPCELVHISDKSPA